MSNEGISSPQTGENLQLPLLTQTNDYSQAYTITQKQLSDVFWCYYNETHEFIKKLESSNNGQNFEEQIHEENMELNSQNKYHLNDQQILELQEKRYSQLNQLGGVAGIMRALKTSYYGLYRNDNADYQQRQKLFGRNDIILKPSKNLVQFVSFIVFNNFQFFNQFKDKIIILMIVIITAQGILDALTLPSYDQIVFQQSFHDFIMVLLAAFVYGMYDYWIEIKLTSNLQENLERQVLVLRQGQIDNLHIILLDFQLRLLNYIRDLVTGDIISLKQGDCVPVDIVVIESDGLEIDEKQVFNKDKQLQEDMQTIILAGSYIMRGQCKGLVCQVGKQLIAQKVSKKLQYLDQNIPTPNQFKSYVVGKYILKVSVIISIIISGILLSRILIEEALMLHQETYIELFQQGLYVLKVFILLLFVALPENASICISTYFAINMEKMRKEGILVRSLEALEVMGSTVELLAGKTGILTENRMTVVRVFSEGNLHLNITRLQPKTQELIIQGCSLNSNSHILYDEQNDQELRIGNQIECAILKFVDSNLFKLNYREKCYQDVRDRFKILRVIPFSQDNKKMTVVVELIPGKLVRVFTKGASENLIAESYKSRHKQKRENQGQYKLPTKLLKPYNNFEISLLKQLTTSGLRTISLGYKDISYDEYLVQYERLINQGQEKELSQIIDYQDQFQQELEQLEEEDIIQRTNFDSEIIIQNKTQLLRLDQGLTLICILGIKDPLRLGKTPLNDLNKR